jgi:hypothetical protein
MFVTEDDEKHFVAPSPAAVTALVALTQAPTIFLWDPEDRTLIAANPCRPNALDRPIRAPIDLIHTMPA